MTTTTPQPVTTPTCSIGRCASHASLAADAGAGGMAVGGFAFDGAARAVLELPMAASAAVFGVPGSGKTTLACAIVADRVQRGGLRADEVLLLAATRATATRLRDDLALAVGRTTRGPLARTVHSVAFELASAASSQPILLMTGAEQDRLIAELLAGAEHDGGGVRWPDSIGPEVRRLRAFRTELRELLMLACEHGITAEALTRLGERADRPAWVAAAGVQRELDVVVGQLRDVAWLHSSELVVAAASALRRGVVGSTPLSGIRCLVVDDAQEATQATAQLVGAFAAAGATVIALGDPDVASNGFRGGRPDLLGSLATVVGGSVQRFVLERVYRGRPQLHALGQEIVERIGTALGGTHRGAVFVGGAVERAVRSENVPDRDGRDPDVLDRGMPCADAIIGDISGVFVLEAGVARCSRASSKDSLEPALRIEANSATDEMVQIAALLRERHLLDGIPWSRMAVVARSGAQLARFERGLSRADIPTATSTGRTHLAENAATRALLSAAAQALSSQEPTVEFATDLLTGPFGALDAVALRQLRRGLRHRELASGGDRLADVLLVAAFASGFGGLESAAARDADRVVDAIGQARAAARRGVAVTELLWMLWEHSGMAERIADDLRRVGALAADAHRMLDAVVALFAAARSHVERTPDEPALSFVRQALEAEVPEDTLAAQREGDRVRVDTPGALIGEAFDVVVVAGMQDGVWPNLRLRGTLLGLEAFAAMARAGATATDGALTDPRAAVRSDELRLLLLAVSRACRQVVFSAVANDDEAPSVLLGLVATRAQPRARPLQLRRLVGVLRRQAVANPQGEAVAALAALAEHRVPGAHPDDWYGLRAPSTVATLAEAAEPVPMSPSHLERAEVSPMAWFLDRVAAPAGGVPAAVGTIVHAVVEEAARSCTTDVEALWGGVAARWAQLGLSANWVTGRELARARALIGGAEAYLIEFAESGGVLAEAERRFAVTVGGVELVGTIDRVEVAPDGTAVIVDLKTGRQPPTSSAVASHAQLAAYQLAARHGAIPGIARNGGAKLVYLATPTRGVAYRQCAQQPFDDAAEAAFVARITTIAERVTGPSFAAPIDLGARTPEQAWQYQLQIIPAVSA